MMLSSLGWTTQSAMTHRKHTCISLTRHRDIVLCHNRATWNYREIHCTNSTELWRPKFILLYRKQFRLCHCSIDVPVLNSLENSLAIIIFHSQNLDSGAFEQTQRAIPITVISILSQYLAL
jgi:hypothetical protein